MFSNTPSIVRSVIGALTLLALPVLAASPSLARDGHDVYAETCDRCHGILQGQESWYRFPSEDGAEVRVAVITPRGPTLNNIVGRPAGIIAGHAYSKGMRAFAKTGAVWDRATLDKFLTNSRKFVKGTFMIVKLNEEDRKLVLDLLEQVAPYDP